MDSEQNFYVATLFEIRKLNRKGQHVWKFSPKGTTCQSPSLMGNALFGTTENGYLYSVDLETGKANWEVKAFVKVTGDTAYVEADDGVVVVGFEDEKSPIEPGGNPQVGGFNATDGSRLWTFTTDMPTWNIMAMFTGDGNLVFQTQAGSVYCLGLHDGVVKWRNSPESRFKEVTKDTLRHLWTDGGTTLGPNGLVYVGSNLGFGITANPGGDGRPSTVPGLVGAYDATTGELAWMELLERPMMSWPAVGRLGKGPRLSVVATLGANPGLVPAAHKYTSLPLALRGRLHEWSVKLGRWAKYLWWTTGYATQVVAMDAETGQRLWTWTPPVYERECCAGDEEGFGTRLTLGIRTQCLTASWGAPTIGGDGVVYAPHMSGLIYAIKDINEDGNIDEATEVTSFDAGTAFLHGGPSFAPGTMAVTTCDSLFVFNT